MTSLDDFDFQSCEGLSKGELIDKSFECKEWLSVILVMEELGFDISIADIVNRLIPTEVIEEALKNAATVNVEPKGSDALVINITIQMPIIMKIFS